MDLADVNAEGLRGQAGGLRAVHYEFCIPAGDGFRAEVHGVDATTEFMPHSRGRIGCAPEAVLVVGNTHQPGFRAVLDQLASLPYVERIIEAQFE